MNNRLSYIFLILGFFFTTSVFGEGITFTFSNQQVSGSSPQYFEFDVMAQGVTGGTNIGDSQIYINYNTVAFGESIETNGKITVTKGTLSSGAFYSLGVTDNTNSKVAISAEYALPSSPELAHALPASVTSLVHVKIEIANHGETTNLTFDPTLMIGQQFESDNSTTYVPVTAVDSDDSPLPVELTSFTAEDEANGVVLKWTTESETENLGFMLERRISETKEWNLLANYKTDDALEGQGSTSGATDYEYIDKLVENGKEYEYRLADVDYNGLVTYHATRFVTANNFVLKVVPEKFELLSAYPNPFNPYATIRYSTPKESIVKITIYNQIGQKVRVLQKGSVPAGKHSIVWDSRDEYGQPMSAGVYLFNIEAGGFNKTHKMILLK